jgi:urea transport system ATP-binding protein
MLEIVDLETYYGESRIINGLNLTVKTGSVTCLIGRNGVGKTTTLRSIMGLVRTPAGKIIFDGKDIIKLPAYDRVRLGIGYVPQGRDIFPQMTVRENLELGLQPLAGKRQHSGIP